MSFNFENLPKDYEIFLGAVSFLLRRVQPDPLSKDLRKCEKLSTLERAFVQPPPGPSCEVMRHAAWMLQMTQRCCFSLTSFVCGLIYMEKLRQSRNVVLYESTWRSIWVNAMILSEKWWEDNYVHPGHITRTYGSQHTQREFLENQLAIFKALHFRLNVHKEEFNRWQQRLASETVERGILQSCPFQKVFIPRPIPNLKVRKPENQKSSVSEVSTTTPLSGMSGRSPSGSESERRGMPRRGGSGTHSWHSIAPPWEEELRRRQIEAYQQQRALLAQQHQALHGHSSAVPSHRADVSDGAILMNKALPRADSHREPDQNREPHRFLFAENQRGAPMGWNTARGCMDDESRRGSNTDREAPMGYAMKPVPAGFGLARQVPPLTSRTGDRYAPLGLGASTTTSASGAYDRPAYHSGAAYPWCSSHNQTHASSAAFVHPLLSARSEVPPRRAGVSMHQSYGGSYSGSYGGLSGVRPMMPTSQHNQYNIPSYAPYTLGAESGAECAAAA